MNTFSDARLFVQTIQNDKYLHEDAIILGLRKETEYFGLPYCLNKYLKFRLEKLIFISLYPVALLVITSKDLLKHLFKKLLFKKRPLSEDNYFIASTNFSKSINIRINKHIEKSCWIFNLDVNPKDFIIPSDRFIYCYQLLGFSDIFSAAVGTLYAYTEICMRYGTFYMLCSLNAFKWLLFFKSCKNIPKSSSIYFVNHKDRWAFLEDHIECKKKTLIQHGTEISNCTDEIAKSRNVIPVAEGEWTQCMPYKYKTLTNVVAFSEKEMSAMKLSIIECNPEFVVGGYGFETYPLDSNRFSVLIIAHSGDYFEKEREIIENLQKFDLDLYVKNHPTQSNEPYIKLQEHFKFKFITEQKFPHVNIVITYDSTLAHEYQSVGIDVIYHTKTSINEINKIISNRL